MAKSDRCVDDQEWHDAFLKLWFALENEGRDPAHVTADWAGRKPSTVRSWKRGGCTPDDPHVRRRLARKSLAAGYDHMVVDLYMPGTHRPERYDDSVEVTGRVEDNICDLVTLTGNILEAYRDGNVRRVHRLADKGEKEMDEVRAEAKRKMSLNGKSK